MRRLVAKFHARNNDEGDGRNIFMRTIELNRRIVARLKPRDALSKYIRCIAREREAEPQRKNSMRRPGGRREEDKEERRRRMLGHYRKANSVRLGQSSDRC